jgi:hypothetical protein
MTPKVSIITSLYKGGAHIKGFLDDIVNQTIFEEICELIIVDANSPDNEKDIILAYQKKHPNIIYLRLDWDPGIYGCWNKAIEVARGKYLTNANVDDRKSSKSLEIHLKVMEDNPKADVIYADILVTQSPNETFENNTAIGLYPSPPDASFDAILNRGAPHNNPLWRKSLHEKSGMFDNRYKSAGDLDMWLRFLENGARFGKINAPLGLYYMNPQGMSTNKETNDWKAEEEREVRQDFLSRQKPSKKIIAFSLWGDNPKYTIGAVKNAELAQEIYPDWICRFYVGLSVPPQIIDQLKNFKNVELVHMEEEGDWTGMFWRFLAAEDGDVIMISRDTDSRLNLREKKAVDEWLASGQDFHIMRDHPYHKTEILGGMWGCRRGILEGIGGMMDNYKKGDFWQVDQNFLREKIYPLVKDRSFVHDEFFESRPFPTPREGREYVGEAFDEKEVHDQKLREALR